MFLPDGGAPAVATRSLSDRPLLPVGVTPQNQATKPIMLYSCGGGGTD